MTKKSFRIAGIALMLALGGCVTKSAYEQLEAEKNQEISRLQADRDAVQRQRDELQKQVEALDAQRSALELQKASLEQDQVALQTRVGLLAQERTSLEHQQADLKKQIEALEKQKQQLLAASEQTQSQYDKLVRNLTEEVKKGELQVRQYKNMLTVDVAEQLFFDSGEASLKATGKEVLKKVGESLKSYDDKMIRIVGHTDNVPIAKSRQKVYASNWELSVARATTVVRYLQEVGVPPERMMAAGRAEYAPVAGNDSADGRKKNRRIEITLVDRNLESVQASK
ncbi:MAG: OmpA family protein [Sulfurifustaceae bacterium]